MSIFFRSDHPQADKPFSVAIVRAEYNDDYVAKLLEYAIKGLSQCGIDKKAIEIVSVPGCLEIPFAAKKLMDTADFDGIIALGVVLRGETHHFEIVAQESARGIMDLNSKGEIPVICGILAVNTEAQADERLTKGTEFAHALVSMMNLSSSLAREQEEG